MKEADIATDNDDTKRGSVSPEPGLVDFSRSTSTKEDRPHSIPSDVSRKIDCSSVTQLHRTAAESLVSGMEDRAASDGCNGTSYTPSKGHTIRSQMSDLSTQAQGPETDTLSTQHRREHDSPLKRSHREKKRHPLQSGTFDHPKAVLGDGGSEYEVDHGYDSMQDEGLLVSTWDAPNTRGSKGQKKKLQKIQEYLKVDNSDEDIYSGLEKRRLEGSCRWLTQRERFQEWQASDGPRYFWLRGRPGTGKSVVASHVISHLHNSPCCYHFFKHGEATTTGLSAFLRSIAFQMAKVNEDVREAIFELTQQGILLDENDYRNVWRVVFKGGVFLRNFIQP